MSQSSIVVANAAPSVVRAAINSALAAVASDFSGANAPTTTWPLMKWADTTTNILKIRNLADNAWISFMDLTTGNILTNAATATELAGATGGKWVEVVNGNVALESGETELVDLRAKAQHNLYQISVYSTGFTFGPGFGITEGLNGAGLPFYRIKKGSDSNFDTLEIYAGTGANSIETFPVTFYYKVWVWE